MEEFDIKKIKKEIMELLKNEEYEGYDISYMLIDKVNPEDSIAIAMKYDEIIEINIKSHEINSVAEWAYNFDEDIFKALENNNEIGYMSMDTHYSIWHTINELYLEEIDNKKGMQRYLKYCKENNVTKKVIEKETEFFDVPDVMQYLKTEKQKNKKKEAR